MSTTIKIETLNSTELEEARKGSYYFIAGSGGDLHQWVDGYEKALAERQIGKPVAWYKASGASVSLHATRVKGGALRPADQFPEDLTCLLFPLDGLNVGALAVFKIMMADRWYDDVIANMEVAK